MERIVPPSGIITLSQKIAPTCTLDSETAYSTPICVLRGTYDSSALKQKILMADNKIWESTGQQTNVFLKRPAHDEWGIGKIVFIYCDDFIKRVFHLPWFQHPEWRDLILPIFESIGVDPNKVIRCLLAKMNPGSTIPVHHDTGFWVPRSHRLHVPIITNERVVFRVGLNENEMIRFAFDEGYIIELNNQAKHAVDNFWDGTRVHLIFDYVEDFPLQIVHLEPGQKLKQTRRTIDLESEQGTNPAPRFIIIGAQKSGTTSMFEYLNQHPLIIKGKRRETHFFDWRWQENLLTVQEQYEFYTKFFEVQVLTDFPSLSTGESTPSYLLHSNIVIQRIKNICPWVKLIVMLRDPVARAYSQYQMCIDPEGTPIQKKNRGLSKYIGKTFEQVIQLEMKELEDCGISPTISYDDFAKNFLPSRPLNHGGHSMLARGMYAIQLIPWLESFPPDQIKIIRMEDLRENENVQSIIDDVFNFIELPSCPVECTQAHNTRTYPSISPETQQLLTEFYRPYNERLYEMLGRNMQW